MTDTNTPDPLATECFDELFLYDQAIIRKFTEGTVRFRTKSLDVPIIMGTAQRAFSELKRLYGLPATGKRIPLPAGNLIRGDMQLDMSRYMSSSPVRGSMKVSEPALGMSKRMQRPMPVTCQYSMQIRCANMSQRNTISKQFLLIANNEKFVIPVTIPDFGSWNMMATHQGTLDSSEYNVDEFDKIHLISIGIIYEAWLFYPTSIHKMIKGAGVTWEVTES